MILARALYKADLPMRLREIGLNGEYRLILHHSFVIALDRPILIGYVKHVPRVCGPVLPCLFKAFDCTEVILAVSRHEPQRPMRSRKFRLNCQRVPATRFGLVQPSENAELRCYLDTEPAIPRGEFKGRSKLSERCLMILAGARGRSLAHKSLDLIGSIHVPALSSQD